MTDGRAHASRAVLCPSRAVDVRSMLLNLASSRVKIVDPMGKKRKVMLIEARILELASPNCRRRLLCQEFISLVRSAVHMTADEFNGQALVEDFNRFREKVGQ